MTWTGFLKGMHEGAGNETNWGLGGDLSGTWMANFNRGNFDSLKDQLDVLGQSPIIGSLFRSVSITYTLLSALVNQNIV